MAVDPVKTWSVMTRNRVLMLTRVLQMRLVNVLQALGLQNVQLLAELLELCAKLAFSDAIGSVAFHPLQPVLLSVSGSRHFTGEELDGSSSEEDDAPIRRPRTRLQPSVHDATAKLWSFASSV